MHVLQNNFILIIKLNEWEVIKGQYKNNNVNLYDVLFISQIKKWPWKELQLLGAAWINTYGIWSHAQDYLYPQKMEVINENTTLNYIRK